MMASMATMKEQAKDIDFQKRMDYSPDDATVG
jgi:hypothetical protein